jgi:four helix bundle protein
MPAANYSDLIAWKKAFELALTIYRITSNFPIEEKYGITSQLRRAGVSVPSNIAEGQGRNSRGEFRHYLSIAQGSLKEIETQVLIAIALGYLGEKQADMLMARTAEVGRLVTGLSKSLLNR